MCLTFYGLAGIIIYVVGDNKDADKQVFRGSSMVEQAAVNRKVEGSSPSLGAIFICFATVWLAGVAELADAQDLKSCDPYRSYRFDPGLRHQYESSFVKEYRYRGVEQLVARRAHNPEVVGSNPAPATMIIHAVNDRRGCLQRFFSA